MFIARLWGTAGTGQSHGSSRGHNGVGRLPPLYAVYPETAHPALTRSSSSSRHSSRGALGWGAVPPDLYGPEPSSSRQDKAESGAHAALYAVSDKWWEQQQELPDKWTSTK